MVSLTFGLQRQLPSRGLEDEDDDKVIERSVNICKGPIKANIAVFSEFTNLMGKVLTQTQQICLSSLVPL